MLEREACVTLLRKSGRTFEFTQAVTALVHAGQPVRVRLLELADAPHRSVFTAVRQSLRDHPGIVAVRAALAAEATELNYRAATSDSRRELPLGGGGESLDPL